MKSRLQRLWDETVPLGGAAPQANCKAVLRRVRSGLDEKAAARSHRRLRWVVVAAAAALLLALGGMAVAAHNGGLAEFNVLRAFFWEGSSAEAEALVESRPLSVSDENYRLTVTSSIADGDDLYFTLELQAKTARAREVLASKEARARADNLSEVPGLWQLKPNWLGSRMSSACYEDYDEENGILRVSGTAEMGFGLRKKMAVRFNDMEEDLWLRFPVKPLAEVKLPIEAKGQGSGCIVYAAGGPVYLKHVVLTPLSLTVKFDTEYETPGMPVLYFLWKDGHLSSFGEMEMVGPSGGGAEHCEYSWQFLSVQDLGSLEALVFEGIAYPLDRGTPYPVDTSEMRRPFAISRGEAVSSGTGMHTVPLFALCEGLDIPHTWDSQTNTLCMTYRDVTVCITEGSHIILRDGEEWELVDAPVLRDGELWADVAGTLRFCWNLDFDYAYDDLDKTLEEGLSISREENWLVTP